LVHLYKLLCGVAFGRSSSSNALPLRVRLRQETGKTHMQLCGGSFVAQTAVECGVRPTSTAQVGPGEQVLYALPRYRPLFLGHYGEMHQAEVSMLLNKNAVSQFGVVQRGDAERHYLNSIRELSDQASFFPN
jgi:hypothetical protein